MEIKNETKYIGRTIHGTFLLATLSMLHITVTQKASTELFVYIRERIRSCSRDLFI